MELDIKRGDLIVYETTQPSTQETVILSGIVIALTVLGIEAVRREGKVRRVTFVQPSEVRVRKPK
jgi:hypothetical protein